MAERPRRLRRWMLAGLLALAALVAAAAFVWRDDILRTSLDPKIPFQAYDPPPAPDYSQRDAWALLPTQPAGSAGPPVDVFFIGPTTYDGGRHWNAPLNDKRADQIFRRVMAPNYAGPFVRVGRLFAPRYRQGSLYTLLTLRDDAREARAFAYGDVQAAFRTYLQRYNRGRPFILVGVEQGGPLGARLLAKEAADPQIRERLVAAYLVETLTPAAGAPLPLCVARRQTGCLAAWASAYEFDPERSQNLLSRSLFFNAAGELETLQGQEPVCFNPILGRVTDDLAPARLHLGAANATGLEWEARPAFLPRQVSAHCERGVLRVSRPKSASLKPTGSWAVRRRAAGYNLFYADLEADAKARIEAFSPRPSAARPDASRTAPAAP
jgi:hypothetical protein